MSDRAVRARRSRRTLRSCRTGRPGNADLLRPCICRSASVEVCTRGSAGLIKRFADRTRSRKNSPGLEWFGGGGAREVDRFALVFEVHQRLSEYRAGKKHARKKSLPVTHRVICSVRNSELPQV